MLFMERKTYSDLWSSIRDGRYKEQRARFLEIRNPFTKCVYVIEGNGDNWDAEIQNTCERTILRLQIAYDIPVIRTHSIEDTHRLLKQIYDQQDLFILFKKRDGVEDQIVKPIAKKEFLNDPTNFLMNVLTLIPSVSFALAKKITDSLETKTICGLCHQMNFDDLAAIQYCPNKKMMLVGKTKASRIFKVLGLNT